MHSLSHLELPSGISIEIEQWGHGERPLVLVHGFTGSRDDWREQLPALSEIGQTIAIDLRGHGGSTNPGEAGAYRLALLGKDLEHALEVLGFEQYDLLGHSMGGMVALLTTLSKPDRIASLVLMDTTARGIKFLPRSVREATQAIVAKSGMQGLATVMRQASEAERGPTAPAMSAAIEKMGADIWWARITAKLLAMDPVAYATLGDQLGDWPGVVDRLGEIACPTTVIVGDQDTPFRDPSEELVAGIAGALSVVIPDAAHSPQLENPDVWLAAITDHLSRARAPLAG